ncbi:MAG: glycosyltransferase family 39 protein [Humidesulfovibrio sp.]|nr:glycosyltransferase family 39 protein [Humidesulfovibrio sp.]
MSRNRLLASLTARPGLWAFLLIAASTALRFWFVGTHQLGLVQDEAQYWDWTRHMQLTYYSKGPLIAWIIWAGTQVFGNTELGVRLGAIVGMVLFPALVWLLVAKLWKRPVLAVLSIFVLSVAPLFEALGILMTTDNPFVVCWALAMIALYAATTPDEEGRDRGLWPFVLLALAYGVGILAKYTMLGLAGLAVLHGYLLQRRGALPARYWLRLALALTLGILGGFLPTLIWNMQNNFVGYKHVMYLIGLSGKGAQTVFRISRVPEYVGGQLGFALPWWFCLAVIAGWRIAKQVWRSATDNNNPLALTLPQASLLAVFFWPVTLFFLSWSFHTKVLANWNTVSFVAGSLLCAVEIERLLHAELSVRSWRWLKTAAWASVFLVVFIHVHQVLPLPPSLNPANRLKGWEDMAQHVHEISQTRFQDPSRVFFMSNVYDITAELAFYVPGQAQAYCLWGADRRMNQYDLWGGPKDKLGWDAILVLRGDSPGYPSVASDMFASFSGPFRYVATFRDHPVRPFYYYLCYGYKGVWPRQENAPF